MSTSVFTNVKDFFHAQICYQLFITHLHLPLEKEYRDFAKKACDYFFAHRTESKPFDSPRHHVIHRFNFSKKKNPKKILIAHGWMSRAAYMIRLIKLLSDHGFDVYALDFPAHGESKGFQLTWIDAVMVLRQIINEMGPFYATIGHSFGGSMLLNTLNLSSQFQTWQIKNVPERVVMIASPTRMQTPVAQLARRLRLSGKGYLFLRDMFQKNAILDSQHLINDIKCLDFQNYITRTTTPFLCVHGVKDQTIAPEESIIFCKKYSNASLVLLPDADHVSVLMDERVEKIINQFLL